MINKCLQQFTRRFPLSGRILLIAVDAFLLPFVVWLSFWLRVADPFHDSFLAAGLWLTHALLLIGLPLCFIPGRANTKA